MNKCLIGYTGFVGGSLMNQTDFDSLYNSKNIEEIKNKKFELIVCAGAPAVKWKANQEPEADLENINKLIGNLKTVTTDFMILVSTVDVYANPVMVDEDTLIDPNHLEPYGKHRYILEEFVRNHFVNHLIIRLPGLFGKGLKKNLIYDFIHNNCLDLQHSESKFQFYDMSNLWKDILISKENNLSLVNFATEPLQAKEIAGKCFDSVFNNVTEKLPANYDMRSKFSSLYSPDSSYMYNKETVLKQILEFKKVR